MDDKGVHTYPKSICLKANVIVRLKFELAYNDSAIHHFNYYIMRTLPRYFNRKIIKSFFFFWNSVKYA